MKNSLNPLYERRYQQIGVAFYFFCNLLVFPSFSRVFSELLNLLRNKEMIREFDDENTLYNYTFFYFCSILTFIFFIKEFQKYIILIKYITFYLGISFFILSFFSTNFLIKFKSESIGTVLFFNSHWIYFFILWIETLIYQNIKFRVYESRFL
jgi:hypothetical protein